MTNSGSKPEVIFLDRVEDGRCRLLVHWNIVDSTKEDPMTGEIRESWDYSERIIWWDLKLADVGLGTLDEIKSYLITNEEEIVDWAKATALNYDGTDCKKKLGK